MENLVQAESGWNESKKFMEKDTAVWRDMTWKQGSDSYTVKYLITAEGFVLFDGKLIASDHSVFITATFTPELSALPNLRFYASRNMGNSDYDSISQTALNLTSPSSIREVILQYDI